MWDGHSGLSAHRSSQDLSKYWRDYFRFADKPSRIFASASNVLRKLQPLDCVEGRATRAAYEGFGRSFCFLPRASLVPIV
jgi:hypothetical protein